MFPCVAVAQVRLTTVPLHTYTFTQFVSLNLQASLVTVQEKIAEAISQDKPKKAEKLEEMKKEALDRK